MSGKMTGCFHKELYLPEKTSNTYSGFRRNGGR
jgi:hypothetical protein